MASTMFARFRPIIAAATEAEIHQDITLGGKLTMARDDRFEVSYAPFEHIVATAQVVIVGITPGAQQAGNALAEVRRQILAGADDATALEAAKVHGSFSGPIRDGLVGMLDHVGLNQRLGIPTCDRLWDSHAHLAHFTSALRYPVFRDGKNFNGNPVARRPAILRGYVETCLAEEARALPRALWIPCGGKAAAALQWLVRMGVLDAERVCLGMLHPSGANAERVQYFLGTGRARADLSSKTNPDLIDRAKVAMIAKVAGFSVNALPPASVAQRVPVKPSAPTVVAPSIRSAKPRAPGGRMPSKLGQEVHDAVANDPRFVRHDDDRQYLCTYRTLSGTVFGFERVTSKAVKLWLPATEAVANAAAAEGIAAPVRSLAFPYPDQPGQYGRLATLEYVPELEFAELYPIKVTSGRQALAVLHALR